MTAIDPFTHVVCESYPEYKLHIRKIDGTIRGPSLTLGGYGPNKPETICGKTIDLGWDTKQPLPTADRAWNHPGGHTCNVCYAIWVSRPT